MLRTLFILLFLFSLSLWPVRSHPDPLIDSLIIQLDEAHDTTKIDLFNQLSEIFWQRSFDTSLLMAEHAVALAREVDDPVRLGTSLNMKGNAYYLLSNFTMGLQFYQEALYINANRNRIKKKITNLLQEKNQELEVANKKLVESEHNLRDLNATKDKFFSIIGHDLRNPLNALIGFSELIAANSREFSKEDIQKYSRIINESAKNIHQLIENLLNWSRTQTGNIDFSPAHIRLFDIVSEIYQVLKIHADNKNIRIEIDIPETLEVFADKNLLSTTLRNLMGNAVKFTAGGGKVFLAAKKEDDKILVSVTDTGIGMDQEQIDMLFTLGAGISTPGTTKEQGTGLGLILCKEFIEMHDGKIWVESETGKGSTFKFTIPEIKND